MKYSQTIGVLVSVLLIASCFLHWAHIAYFDFAANKAVDVWLTGFNGKVNEQFNFGRAGIIHTFLAAVMIIFFLLDKIFAKRANFFVGAVQVAWAIKNLIVFGMCRNGECPVVQYGLYITLVLAFIALLMALLPAKKLQQLPVSPAQQVS